MTKSQRDRLKIHAGTHPAWNCQQAMRMISRVLWPPPRFVPDWTPTTVAEIAKIVIGQGYGPGGENL